jgi:1-acyl-sn-glycerol-3-phosphate acyltransferase
MTTEILTERHEEPSRQREGRTIDASLVPPVRPWLRDWFMWYVERNFFRRDFHGVWVAKRGRPPAEIDDRPLILFANHPSWWDPLIAMLIMRHFYPEREYYAPMDEAALNRYSIFKSLGFYPVERDTRRGAMNFLNTSLAVLSRPYSGIAITPSGRLHDVRKRPIQFEPGVGALARRLDRGILLPLALEYTFWYERTPEALLYFGEPIEIADHPDWSSQQWTTFLRDHLVATMDTAIEDAISREGSRYDLVLGGRLGVGGLYDLWRRSTSWITGQSFKAGHKDLS